MSKKIINIIVLCLLAILVALGVYASVKENRYFHSTEYISLGLFVITALFLLLLKRSTVKTLLLVTLFLGTIFLGVMMIFYWEETNRFLSIILPDENKLTRMQMQCLVILFSSYNFLVTFFVYAFEKGLIKNKKRK